MRLPGGGGGVGVDVPTGTSCHCWLVPFQSAYWTMLPPSAVEAPCTSSALPLLRLISRTLPDSEPTRMNCWWGPLVSVHCTTGAPSAVDLPETSSTLPESFDRSR